MVDSKFLLGLAKPKFEFALEYCYIVIYLLTKLYFSH